MSSERRAFQVRSRSANANNAAAQRARGARQRATGGCYRCNDKALPGERGCAVHVRHKSHVCGECDQPGHNMRTCARRRV